MESSGGVQDGLFLIPHAIVVIGWAVLLRNSFLLKDREDAKRIVDSISETCDAIFDSCILYYEQKDDRHISLISGDIKAKFVLLSHYLSLARKSGLQGDFSRYLRDFKKQATGFHFETIHFKQQMAIPNWYVDLSAAASEMKFRTESSYFAWSRRKGRSFLVAS